jgi:WD40 repeat protein
MENELNTQFVCAYHEIKDEELEVEKNIVKKFNEKDDSLNAVFKNIYYPIFQYERIRLPNAGNGPLPYGECFTTAFNADATLLACGYSNGHVNIFNLVEKKDPIKFKVSDFPVTSIKWNEKKKVVIIVGSADGTVSHWHVHSGKKLHSIQEEKNAINCVDYSFDYKNFITAGNDITVRLYDEDMKTEIATMKPYLFNQPGHSGRIFCVKYFPNDTSTIYSGGWDKTIQFYDTRTCKVANSIYGPEICGDSLDLNGNVLASGAWSTEEQIQLWDIRTLKCICNVKWETNSVYKPTYIYSVKFNKNRDNKYLTVAGVNKPLFTVFNMNTFKPEQGLKDTNRPTPILGTGENYHSCFTTDFVKINNNKELFCCGCGDGGARVYNFNIKN